MSLWPRRSSAPWGQPPGADSTCRSDSPSYGFCRLAPLTTAPERFLVRQLEGRLREITSPEALATLSPAAKATPPLMSAVLRRALTLARGRERGPIIEAHLDRHPRAVFLAFRDGIAPRDLRAVAEAGSFRTVPSPIKRSLLSLGDPPRGKSLLRRALPDLPRAVQDAIAADDRLLQSFGLEYPAGLPRRPSSGCHPGSSWPNSSSGPAWPPTPALIWLNTGSSSTFRGCAAS